MQTVSICHLRALTTYFRSVARRSSRDFISGAINGMDAVLHMPDRQVWQWDWCKDCVLLQDKQNGIICAFIYFKFYVITNMTKLNKTKTR